MMYETSVVYLIRAPRRCVQYRGGHVEMEKYSNPRSCAGWFSAIPGVARAGPRSLSLALALFPTLAFPRIQLPEPEVEVQIYGYSYKTPTAKLIKRPEAAVSVVSIKSDET